jgi:hypothetical protein
VEGTSGRRAIGQERKKEISLHQALHKARAPLPLDSTLSLFFLYLSCALEFFALDFCRFEALYLAIPELFSEVFFNLVFS